MPMHWRAFRHLLDAMMHRTHSRGPKSFYKPIVDLNEQTRQLADGSRICNYLRQDRTIRRHYTNVRTLFDAVRRGARQSNNGPMLGARNMSKPGGPFEWINYDEVLNRSVDVAHAFRKLGLEPGQKTFIGIYAKNRPEWIIIEHATYSFNNVLVPLYETFEADSCVYIINQAEIQLVVCDSLEKANSLLGQRRKCPGLRVLVVTEERLPAAAVANAEAQGVKLMTMAELERLGRDQPRQELQPPTKDDLATICYTSGTTGTPKGVMLTHGNIIADGTTLDFFDSVELSMDDVMMSFLPLAHMFERVVQLVMYTEGGRVGFFNGDIKNLPDDIKTLHPTILPVVPRVLNRVHDKVANEVEKSKFKKILFEVAMKYKILELHLGIISNTSWIDKLVFGKIREGMGGRVKLMITGSAPLDESVLDFIRAAMGCTVVEGYGQTEAVACVSITLEGDAVPGHVGVPSPCNAVKLVDVAELGYFAKDDAGEICVRGSNVFKGYYKNEEETRNVLDNDGWLRTGDIGRWTERGTLRIVDRKKHIFKLAQGEYVAPEKIENIYSRSKYVSQSFVHGESLKNCLIGIIVPDPEALSVEAEKMGLLGLSLEQLCARDDIKEMVFNDIIEIGREAKLTSFEQVKDIFLSAEQFTVENSLLTPTLKSKRPKLKEHFAGELEAMYSKLT